MDGFKTSKELYINMSPKDIPYWNPNLPYWEQSIDAILFWENEYDKIRNGVNLGGYYMNGWMYFHLNHFTTRVMDTRTKEESVRQPLFDDNIYFLMECFNKATREGLGFVMWGTRGFAKTTFMASHEEWTHLCRNLGGGLSVVIGGTSRDLKGMETAFKSSNNKISSPLKLNVLSGETDWSKGVDMMFGHTLSNNTKLTQSGIIIINAEGGSDKASEKAAGFTPIGFKMDEIGKFNPIPVFESAKISFKQSGVATFTFVLGGCVCAGTKVWNNRGELVNIEDLKADEGILGYNGNSYSKEPIEWIKPPHKKECYRIELEGGNNIECSHDHPFLTINKNIAEAIKAEDIKKGDKLYQLSSLELFGDKSVSDARMIGLMIGDGNYSKGYTPHLSCSDEEIYNYVNSKYNVRVGKTFITKSGELYRNLHIKNFTKVLRDLGIFGQTKQDKRLPSNIHEWDKESIINLLAGYIDSDGNVKVDKKGNLRVVITSSVKELLEEVKYQFYKLGIKTSIYKETRGKNSLGSKDYVYRIYISDSRSANTFKQLFKLLCTKKQSVIDNYVEKTNYKHIRDVKYKVNDLKKGLKLDGVNVENVVPVRVKSVTPIGIKPVYNLTAGNTNTYLANGLVTFNTGGNSSLSEGAKKMLTNPKDYDISIMNWDLLNDMVPDEHITWKEDTGRLFSTFVPGQMSYRDNEPKEFTTFGEFSKFKFKDDELNKLEFCTTNWEKANKFFYDKYDSYTDDETKNKLRMYLPRNISDTFLVDNTNSFDKDKIVQKLEEIKRQPKYELVDIEIDHEGKITKKFVDKPLVGRRYEGKAIEAPIMVFDGFPDEIPGKFHNVSGCDDYKSEDSTTDSLGSIYVLQRRSSTEPLEKIIACKTDRPKRHRTLYENWEKIIRATNALCNIEIADANFVPYLEDTLKVNPSYYLHHFINPHEERNTKKKGTTAKYRYGVYPTAQNKSIMIQEVIDYTQTVFNAGYDPKTNMPIVKCGIDLIEDPWLLQEMLEYQPGSNVDRIVSFGWALVLARYMDRKKVVKEDLHVKKYNDNIVAKKPRPKSIYTSTNRYRNY